MALARDQSVLVKAATLYYLEGKSQAEVAAEIGVSRSNVSRVLAAARTQGIVDIRINDPFGRAGDLEHQLISRFNLADCRVANTGPRTDNLARVGELGAAWLMENLPSKGSLALSWGSAVQSVVDRLVPDPIHSDLEVLPLIGGLSIVDSARDGNVLVRSLALKLGAKHRALHAPAIVESMTTRDAFMAEPSISSVLTAASTARLAIVGIGSVGSGASQTILKAMSLSPDDEDRFLQAEPVGDCCTRYFDKSGTPVGSPTSDRVVGIDLETLRRIPTIVGVAVGPAKAPGVHGALLGGLLDVLIIDSSLAEALLAASMP
ncbi:sugar-binding transcriptional regulator [Terrimesophilobacter mesophilus]|uniref:Sugar-binding transcriptional regulator n=1 Tax=Terrimesophilobacter mesophilus TaxID=433647 RepID=A0A4R8VBZ7_9MICO|nr:sugar-binding transcriptional regulator [Terrimesophilobacter mesophilus]TFB79562.1 sugar-binding transcriptional regulator [Terrimesophilobacter mesophilus]